MRILIIFVFLVSNSFADEITNIKNLIINKELKKYAEGLKIIFFATPFDFSSVDFLEDIGVPCYKLASADLINIPLQKYIAKTNHSPYKQYGSRVRVESSLLLPGALCFECKIFAQIIIQ